MENADYSIILDVTDMSAPVSLNVKQGDAGRVIAVNLARDGVPVGIEPGSYAVFAGKKPDEKILWNSCSIRDSTIFYEITKQTTAVVGWVPVQIRLYRPGGKLVSSPDFVLIVDGTVTDDEEVVIVSENEVTALTELVSDGTALAGLSQEAKEAAQAAAASAATAAAASEQAVANAAAAAESNFQAGVSAEEAAQAEYKAYNAAGDAKAYADSAAAHADKVLKIGASTISFKYGVSSEPMENTVVVWQDTIPQMSETYPYLWIEINRETVTATGGSASTERGLIGYYTKPDSGGNVDEGLRTALVNYYTHVMPNFDDANGLAYINAILTALGAETREEPEEPDTPVEPDEPDTPEVTLSNISAVYSGGDVAVGTALTDLTGIVVTAHYSDGTSESVTGYTLSGEIAEGSNTITVSYEGKTATFTVTGVAESSGNTPVEMTKGQYRWTTKTEYSDGGTTEYDGTMGVNVATAWYSEIFDKDTTVTISVLYGSTNASLRQYAGCVSGVITENNIMYSDGDTYYLEQIGTAKTTEYTAQYTVRAGYRLAVINFNGGNPTSLTVTK